MRKSEPTPGRPRDAEIDRRVLAAALELLISSGYDGLRVDAVAQAAGVPKSTIYRRWPSVTALAVAAVEQAVAHPVPPPTDDPAADLEAVVAALLAGPLGGGLAPALVRIGMDVTAHPEAATAYRERVIAPLRTAAIDAVRRGSAQGRWHADDPELAVDLVIGSVLYRLTYLGVAPTREGTWAAVRAVLGPGSPR